MFYKVYGKEDDDCKRQLLAIFYERDAAEKMIQLLEDSGDRDLIIVEEG